MIAWVTDMQGGYNRQLAMKRLYGGASTGVGVGSGSKGGGPLCTSGTLWFAESVASTDNQSGLTANAFGQSFTVPNTGYLYSIKVYIDSTGTSVVSMRYGNSANLGTPYDSVTDQSLATGSSIREFVFADTVNELQTSTTYYFGLTETSGEAVVLYLSTGGYANGMIYYADSGWNMNNPYSGADVRFEVWKCAD